MSGKLKVINEFPQYISNYAKRHRMASHLVAKHPMLELAAIVEHQVNTGDLTLEQARYIIVASYPATNCIHTDYKSKKFSVLDLVKPIKGCWRQIPMSEYKYQWLPLEQRQLESEV